MKKLDVRGAKCPIPIVKAKKEVDQMQPGELLEVVSTDPGSLPDFKGWRKPAKPRSSKNSARKKRAPPIFTFTCSNGSERGLKVLPNRTLPRA